MKSLTRQQVFGGLIVLVVVAAVGATAYRYQAAPLKTAPTTPAVPAAPDKAAAQAMLNNAALRFQQNKGQVDAAVSFLVRNGDTSIFFTPASVTYTVTVGGSKPPSTPMASPTPTVVAPEAKVFSIRETFVGASQKTSVMGLDPLITKVNYFLSKNSADWIKNIPTFGQIKYGQVYPGIDLVYDGTGKNGLTYAYTLTPGADLKQIRFSYEGIKSLSLTPSGDLVIATVAGNFGLSAPYASQGLGNAAHNLDARYVLLDTHTVGFAVDGADAQQALQVSNNAK